MTIKSRLKNIEQKVNSACSQYKFAADPIKILAVSKTRSVEEIQQAIDAGQRCFAENYLQEALPKIQALQGQPIEWHYIGAIQSNKTHAIAENFAWVHSVDRLKIAQRLNDQRPKHMPALNICIQVNVDNEASKAGVSLGDAEDLVKQATQLEHINCRGLMTMPLKVDDFAQQRVPFCRLRLLLEDIQKKGIKLDTLSMGMSGDFVADIAEGATRLRIGTAIFVRRT